MASLNTWSFGTVVQNFATAAQAAASVLVDFEEGSINLAVGEALAGVVVWLQSLILLLLKTTRLSTSSGNDVDTFVEDFGLTRLPEVAADGQVLFSRFSPAFQAQISPGVTVTTQDGTQSYLVVADTTQSAWNAALNAYVIAPGVASCSATVVAVNTGTQGNVSANTITVIGSAIPFVDTVTNTQPFTSGENAETDTALKVRFVAYIASLSKATKPAIIAAVLALQVGATCTVIENQDYNGTYDPGSFFAVVDDGSGAPPSAFLSTAFNAIDAVRACGIRPAVFAVVGLPAGIAMQITVSPGYTAATVYTAVETALANYVQGLGQGVTLQWAYLPTIAYGIAGVSEVLTGWTINGGQADLVPTAQQRVTAGTMTVT